MLNEKKKIPMNWEPYEIMRAASVSVAKRQTQEQEQRYSLHQNMLNKHNAQFMLLVAGEISIELTHKSDIKWSYAHIKMHQQIIVIKYLTNSDGKKNP